MNSLDKALHRLFLTLFLRGASGRGLAKEKRPKTMVQALGFSIGMYALVGLFCLAVTGQTTFLTSLTLHSMTLMMVGLSTLMAAGEVLFNKEESDILLHRPVTADRLLKAKVIVLLQTSLYLALALNFVGLFVGIASSDGSPLFFVVHLLSVTVEVLFTVSAIVLTYQLCIRWVGREKLEQAINSLQIFVTIGVMLGSQLASRFVMRAAMAGGLDFTAWWLRIFPPTWFASLDDAIAGTHRSSSWTVTAIGVIATVAVAWLAFVRLGNTYETGMQVMGEATTPSLRSRRAGTWIHRLADSSIIRWYLSDGISRASFRLVVAYMARDKETRLKVYPQLTSSLIVPLSFFFASSATGSAQVQSEFSSHLNGFFVAMASSFACLTPVSILETLRYSQQWRATEIFVMAPSSSPKLVAKGTRAGVVLVSVFPILLIVFSMALWMGGLPMAVLLLPGIILLPIFTLIPEALGNAVPFSNPVATNRAGLRALLSTLPMFITMGISGAAAFASAVDLLGWFLLLEALVAGVVYAFLKRFTKQSSWPDYD